MKKVDITDLCAYARQFSGLNDEKITLLQDTHEKILPKIPAITDAFYFHLSEIPKTKVFLEGRMESLKKAHQEWIEELFTSDYDEVYTQKMYHVGDVHVKVQLPVEFMSGAMTIIQGELVSAFGELYPDEPERLLQLGLASNAAIGYSTLVMQESYQSSTLARELENFLSITGMSRQLFDNLARAYK